jgi:hypothetical protein
MHCITFTNQFGCMSEFIRRQHYTCTTENRNNAHGMQDNKPWETGKAAASQRVAAEYEVLVEVRLPPLAVAADALGRVEGVEGLVAGEQAV